MDSKEKIKNRSRKKSLNLKFKIEIIRFYYAPIALYMCEKKTGPIFFLNVNSVKEFETTFYLRNK